MPEEQEIKQNLENELAEVQPERIISPEIQPSPEISSTETGVEVGSLQEDQDAQSGDNEVPVMTAVPPIPLDHQRVYNIVENILAEDLERAYNTMPPELQYKFKVKGEETTNLITKVLSKPKIKVKNIINLVVNWLKLIPGVNRFFLEQTAKIKTDRVLDVVASDEQKIIR